MPIDVSALDIDLLALGPEIILGVTAVAVVLLDLVVREKAALAWASGAGIVLAGAAVLLLWGGAGVANGAFSGVFLLDRYALFFKALVLGTALLTVLASPDYARRFQRFQGEYYGLVLLAAVGMMAIVSAVELVTIYLALEVQTFALVALTAFLKDARSGESALKFLLVSAVSTALMLYGMALLFGLTGTTFLGGEAGIATKVLGAFGGEGTAPSAGSGQALLLAAVLLLAGFGFKIASVPFQMWVPDVYEGGPTPVIAYLSVASKAVGFAVLLRVFYVVFGQPGLAWLEWPALIAALSVLSMTIGNIVAIAQSNLKRLLGYSTIAHAGYLLAGVAALSHTGSPEEVRRAFDLATSGVLFYLAAYAVTNVGAFIAIMAIAERVGGERIEDFAGMGTRSPFLAFALTLALVSLVGLPPTALFVGKVYLFYAVIQSGLWWLALAGVINTFISAYYYLKPIRALYVSPPPAQARAPVSFALRASLLLSMAGIVVLGVVPQQVIRIATMAAGALRP